jgi:hypothetical protein
MRIARLIPSLGLAFALFASAALAQAPAGAALPRVAIETSMTGCCFIG